MLSQNSKTFIGKGKIEEVKLYVEENEIELLLNEVEFDDGFIGERDKLIIELFYDPVRSAKLTCLKILKIGLTLVFDEKNRKKV